MDFNGMVRHYYLRQGPHLATSVSTSPPKVPRSMQSHPITLRLRDELTASRKARCGPEDRRDAPGPPVIATVTAEIYAEPGSTTPADRRGELVRERMAIEDKV